jgi:hypothetical protein
MYALPFSDSTELSCEIQELENPIPFTEVNSKPLDETAFIAPYVACPPEVAREAISFASLNRSDTMVDLGCGDGR